jgi:hypothetical protein
MTTGLNPISLYVVFLIGEARFSTPVESLWHIRMLAADRRNTTAGACGMPFSGVARSPS